MKLWALAFLGTASALALPAGNWTTHALAASSNTTYANTTTTASIHLTTEISTKTVYLEEGENTATLSGEFSSTTVTLSPTYVFPSDRVGPIPTLLPTIPDDHDSNDFGHLTPQDSGSSSAMHYIQPADSGSYDASVFAIVTPNFKNPSVVLDHSAHLTVSASDGNTLIITFSDADAFAHSQQNWGADGGLLFITYTAGCGGYDNGERCYFSATAATYDNSGLVVVVTGSSIALQDAIHDANVVWGSYSPSEVSAGNPVASDTVPQPTSYSGGGGGDDGTPSPSVSGTSTDVEFSPVPTFYSGAGGDCEAPKDTVYGLPTACLGASFDQLLDNGLGFSNSSDFSFDQFLDEITLVSENDDDDSYSPDDEPDEDYDYMLLPSDVPSPNTGVSSSGSSSFGSSSDIVKRQIRQKRMAQLRKRGLGDRIKNAVGKLKTAVKNSASSIASGVKAIGQLAYNVVTGKPNVFDTGVSRLLLPRNSTDCNASKAACKPIDSKTKIVTSPWGDAVLLKSFGTQPSEKGNDKKTVTVTSGKYINLYCVKCGVSGGAKIAGNITINGLQGITAGEAKASFDMSIGVGLGVDAQALYQKQFKNNLYDIPLSPFTLGFVTIGPILSLGTDLTFTANATGRVLARGEFSVARAEWTYDFVKGQARQVGFKPEFRPTVEAEGEVSVSVEFGIPIGLELAITVFDGCTRCKGSVGIIEEPALKAEAAFALESNGTRAGTGIKEINNCTGISTTLSFNNKVSAAVKGFGFAEKEWTIHKTEDLPLKSWCIGSKKDDKQTKPRKMRRESPLLYSREIKDTTFDTGFNFNTSVSKILAATNTTTNSTLLDLTEYVISNVTDIGYGGPDIQAVPYDLSADYLDGYDFTTIVLPGTNGSYVLSACSDDNLYIQAADSSDAELGSFTQCNTLWQRYDDVVVSTPNGGILHYYENTMSKVGVSRLRTGDQEYLPNTSVYVSLIPAETSDDDSASESQLIAIDSSANIFFPAVCTFNATDDGNSTTTQSAKIFLVKDITEGLKMLMSSDIEYSVTGGPVKECYLLPLQEGSDVQGQWASEAGTDDDDDDDEYDYDLEAAAENAE